MKCFLTSTLGTHYKRHGKRIPAELSNKNDFLYKLHSAWITNARILVVAADFNQTSINDSIIEEYKLSLELSGLSFSTIEICDKRYLSLVKDFNNFDVIIFPGGHVKTQNSFYHQMSIKERLAKYDGLLITASAGTMNMSRTVFNPPTFPGEALDMDYDILLNGMDVINHIFIPHFTEIVNQVVDGKSIFKEYIIPWSDSFKMIGITDGTYVLIDGDKVMLFGEAYEINAGIVQQICNNEEMIELLGD